MKNFLFASRQIYRAFSGNIRGVRYYCNESREASEKRPGPLILYRRMVSEKKLKHDPCQERVAFELENLLGRLEKYEKDMQQYHLDLVKWEMDRENERRRLLMEEANLKQKDGIRMTGRNHQFKFIKQWMLRRNERAEPGPGKMVSYIKREKKLDSLHGRRPSVPSAPKGIYLYGSVGSGKTMLMDMFYSATEGIIKHRKRFHFHEAMLEIHDHMHKIWKIQREEELSQSSVASWILSLPFDTKVMEWLAGEERYKKEMEMKNILFYVADRFLLDNQTGKSGASILCFDEIQTVDVFAIVALSAIIGRLLTTGTVLVATSNRAPEDLNQDGMQQDIFQKLICNLREHCQNVFIGSEIDYRRIISEIITDRNHYFWPLDGHSAKEFDREWSEITSQYGGKIESTTIPVMFGRSLEVPESCCGIARFTFDYLCGRPVLSLTTNIY